MEATNNPFLQYIRSHGKEYERYYEKARHTGVSFIRSRPHTLPNVVHVENNMFTCSADTQNLIAESIKKEKLNALVVAACTPRTHEPLFQETLQNTGLNKYMMGMANIRNMNTWVHPHEPEKATEKTKLQVKMAVAKVTLNFPLTDIKVNITPKALIIGGGFSGLSAAKNMADQGYGTILVEKQKQLDGQANALEFIWKNEDVRVALKQLIQDVESHERIQVMTDTTLTRVSGFVGSFTGELTTGDQTSDIEFGTCINTRGNPGYPGSLESAVFIQCVGSRDENHPYCSRVCCTHSIQKAVSLKKDKPEMGVFILYRDIRTYATKEDLHRQVRELGVIFILYSRDKKPNVANENGELTVNTFDPILQIPASICADAVFLATAIEPTNTAPFVDLFKCSSNADGFLMEAHPKLRPADSTVDGVFLAGMRHYPKPIDEAIAQGRAAASRASIILSHKTMKLDAIKSSVTHYCDGCALRVDTCPFNAISLVSYTAQDGRQHQRVQVQEALCKGCGLCAATCPKEGIQVNGFTNGQLCAQGDAVLNA